MPLTLVKEDGSGLGNANSYANVADGDAYHDAHLYAATWTAAVTSTKEKALVMATRLIDANYLFRGQAILGTQALMWPRRGAVDPDVRGGEMYYPENAVPPDLVKATCETARELIAQNRTADPEGEGLSEVQIVGALRVGFDKKDRRPIIPKAAQLHLSKLGSFIDRVSGRLVRA
jgi:hypothetical protein